MTQPTDSFISQLKRLIIIFIYTIKNKLIKLKYKSFFFLSDGLAFFLKENFVIIKYNKNSHISSLVNSNTKSKKKEKNISEFKTELNKKFYR